MPASNTYTQEYINECRTKIDMQIESYNNLVATARDEHITNERLDAAIASFEPLFFNNLLLVLDRYFVNRDRVDEQNNSSPLNEIILICHAIMHNNSSMDASSAIAKPANLILNYSAGDEIRLNETDFIKLANAYFDAMESKYVQQ